MKLTRSVSPVEAPGESARSNPNQQKKMIGSRGQSRNCYRTLAVLEGRQRIRRIVLPSAYRASGCGTSHFETLIPWLALCNARAREPERA